MSSFFFQSGYVKPLAPRTTLQIPIEDNFLCGTQFSCQTECFLLSDTFIYHGANHVNNYSNENAGWHINF